MTSHHGVNSKPPKDMNTSKSLDYYPIADEFAYAYGRTCRYGHVVTGENVYVEPKGYPNCRECRSNAIKKYAELRKDRRRETGRKQNALRSKKPEYRAYMREQHRLHAKRYPEKMLARRRLQQAVYTGKIVKPEICDSCNEPKRLEGHHYSYERAYDVAWLCRQCHADVHYTKVGDLL